MPSSLKVSALPRDTRGRMLREAVEYCLVEHCNLRCAGCDHASPHLDRQFAHPEAFALDLEALSRHLHVRVLRLVGGEPLLHPALGEFVRLARTVAMADQIMLWTNGLLLPKVSRDLLAGFDVVRVSLYPGVRIPMDLAALARELATSGRTRLEVTPVIRFQHQLLNDPIRDPSRVRRIYRRCKEAHALSCHTVHQGRFYKCAKAPLLEPRLARRGIHVVNREHDGIALHENLRLRDELQRYLLSTDPMVACRWCLGTDGTSFPHAQLDEAGLRRERNSQAVDGRDLLANPLRRLVRDVRDRFKAR